jgi:hypothetical protein
MIYKHLKDDLSIYFAYYNVRPSESIPSSSNQLLIQLNDEFYTCKSRGYL